MKIWQQQRESRSLFLHKVRGCTASGNAVHVAVSMTRMVQATNYSVGRDLSFVYVMPQLNCAFAPSRSCQKLTI